MKILALDFSSPRRSAAVVISNVPAATARFEVCETGGAGTKAVAMIEGVLETAGIQRESVDCLAIGLGPGSYTGIRGAIALCQGWELACGAKLMGISSADCIAMDALVQGITGPVAVAVDAQRGEFYLATYGLSASGTRALEPLRLVSLSEAEAAGTNHLLIGPEVSKWFAHSRTVFPTAITLGTIACSRTVFTDGAQLEPIYLRQTAFVKAPPPRRIPGLELNNRSP